MIKRPKSPFHHLEGELEEEYRSFRRREELQALVVAGVVVSVVVLAFIDADLRLVESRALARWIIVGRVLAVAVMVTAFLVVRSRDDHVLRDRWVAICAFAFVLLDIAAAASRPAGFTGNIAVSPVIALVLYVAVPGPQMALGAAALLESVGAVVATAQNEAGFAILFSLVGALVVANCLGLLAMARMNRWGRDQFVAIRSLRATNESLKVALAEVRSLREIVPVCSSCKSVRDDTGFWQRVEDYICRYTGGEVSHGICPDCYDRLYGELVEHE